MNEPRLLFTEVITAHLSSRRAPVFKHLGDHGQGWGSGAFLRVGAQVCILTNAHVAAARALGESLASQIMGQEEIWKIVGDHLEYPSPLDLALLPVPEEVWRSRVSPVNAYNSISTRSSQRQIVTLHEKSRCRRTNDFTLASILGSNIALTWPSR